MFLCNVFIYVHIVFSYMLYFIYIYLFFYLQYTGGGVIGVDKEYEAKLKSNASIKEKTLALYALLPEDEEGRKARTDIRDKIIELNYAFFGYVASHTFINNSSVTYEDKLQSALLHFCECWWWYKWAERYRTDLSFTVFFKPRIGEMIERELNEVKYSIRRSLCMEVGEQLGKHWGKVTYEDLSDPNLDLPIDKLNSLKAIFGSLYIADVEDHLLYIEAPAYQKSIYESKTDEYDSVEDFLINQMIELECKITDDMLIHFSDKYGLDIKELRDALPIAEEILYKRIKENLDLYSED